MFRRFLDHLQDSIRILLQHTQQQLCLNGTGIRPPLQGQPTVNEASGADPTAMYEPTRWLLMSCYEAVHANNRIRPSRHEGMVVALFDQLTGEHSLALSAEDKLALYQEATGIYRRAGQLCSIRPTQKSVVAENKAVLANLEKWLVARPETLAAGSTLVPSRAQHGHQARVRTAARKSRESIKRSNPSWHERLWPEVSVTHMHRSSILGGRGPLTPSELGSIALFRGHPQSQSTLLTPPRDVHYGGGTSAFWGSFGRERRRCAAAQM